MIVAVGMVKGDSSEWADANSFVRGKFKWQEGYGAFSYERSQINQVYQYIMDQKRHHQKKSFLEEYVQLLEKFAIPYDKRYVFKPIPKHSVPIGRVHDR